MNSILRQARWFLTLAFAIVVAVIGVGARNAAEARSARDDLAACSEALRRPVPSATGELREELSVLSWNTMKYGVEGSRELLERLSSDVDLVFLQESLRSVAPPQSFRGTRYFGDGYAYGREQSGVELRSASQAHVECSLRFIEPWLRSPKAVLATRHAMGREGLLLVNLHAVNFTLGMRAYTAQLDAVAALLRSHDGPAIVAGDFNNWNDRRDSALRRFAVDNGLAMANFKPDLRSRHLGRPVDGVLQRGFEAVSATAVPTQLSDHHPLLLLLTPAQAPETRLETRI